MKRTHLFSCRTLGIAAAVLAVAQGATHSQEGAAVPLRPLYQDTDLRDPGAGPELAPLGEEDPMEIEESIRSRFVGLDLDARELAFDEIAQKASAHPATLSALKSISEDVADPDLAFTARLALREANRLSSWGRAGSSFKSRALQAPEDPFDAIRRELESVFGSDPFMDDFFGADPFAGDPFFRGSRPRVFRGGMGLSPFGSGRAGTDPFEALRARAKEMREQLESMGGDRGSVTPPTVPAPGGFMSSSSMSVENTPEGVRVEIVEDKGNGPERHVFEAPSMEALLEAHPELKGRF